MLGEPDPDAMLDRMDESVFQKWLAFWEIEPFGPMVENRMRARIAAGAAMSGDEDDFLPRAK